MIAYKLLKKRKDGTVGPLYIEASRRVRPNVWEDHHAVKKKGFAFRPGWHTCLEPNAPHIKITPKHQWWKVEIGGNIQEFPRPKAQGGMWFIAERMKLLEPLEN